MVESRQVLEDRITAAMRQGRRASLDVFLRAYLAVRPRSAFSRWLYGDTLRLLGRLGEAEAVLLSVGGVPARRRCQVQLSLAQLYESKGAFVDAEYRYALAVAASPACTVGWIYFGGFLAASGRVSRGIAILSRGLRAAGDVDEVYLNLGNCRRAQRDYFGARADYLAALRLSPDYPEANSALEGVQRVIYAISTAAATGSPSALRQRIIRADRCGLDALVAELAPVYLAARRDDALVEFLFGKALRRLGRPTESERVLLALTDVPDMYQYHVDLNLAMAYRALGRFPEAERRYRDAVDTAPTVPDVWDRLGEFLASSGRAPEAISALSLGLDSAGDGFEMRASLGNCLRAAGDYAAARSEYAAALRMSPDNHAMRNAIQDLEAAIDARAANTGAIRPTPCSGS